MITVFHNNRFLELFLVSFDEKKFQDLVKSLREEDLVAVAQVDTNYLEEAIKLTSNIGECWTKNKEVSLFLNVNAHHIRSTSVGDVLMKEKERYVVAVFGFVKIQ